MDIKKYIYFSGFILGQIERLWNIRLLLLGTAELAADPAFTFDLTVDGEHTKTVAPGDIVTDPRSQAYYIVTEYGGVNLVGCSTWERAEKLISIAHPMFRDELIANAEKQGIWIKSNKR